MDHFCNCANAKEPVGQLASRPTSQSTSQPPTILMFGLTIAQSVAQSTDWSVQMGGGHWLREQLAIQYNAPEGGPLTNDMRCCPSIKRSFHQTSSNGHKVQPQHTDTPPPPPQLIGSGHVGQAGGGATSRGR